MSFSTMKRQQMRTLRWILAGALAVLVSCGGGSSSTQSNPIIDCEANSANVDVWTPDLWVVAGYCYKVGDTGPGGGIIVYVDLAGFDNSSGDGTSIGAMCLKGTCHYLEVGSPALREDVFWEEAIIKVEAFSTSSANDWLLPSKDALNEMCKFVLGDTVNVICNNNGHGSFLNSDGSFYKSYENLPYWSSYEGGDGTALIQYFHSGIQDYYYKGENSLGVRPVRAF